MNATNISLDYRVSRPRRSYFAAAADAPFVFAEPLAVAPVPLPETASASGADPQSGADLARALNDLLTRYVALLDSSWHGGWDQSDDAAVRRARAVLTHAGFADMFPAEIAHHLDLALPGGAPAA